VATGVILALGYQGTGDTLERGTAVAVLVLICIFIAGFAWSW